MPRAKGSLNKATIERLALATKAKDAGITPLEVMLDAMRELLDQGNKVAAAAIAKDAAPYVHPRLQQIEQKTDMTVKKEVSADPLTPEDWEKTYGLGTH